MKFLCYVFFILIATGAPSTMAATEIKEYGVVILPDPHCATIATRFNRDIANMLPAMENVPNTWHVTLYHGTYNTRDLPALSKQLRTLPLKPIDIEFTRTIKNTDDRWIDWIAKKNGELYHLHEAVVNLLSPFHKRPLQRVLDIYSTLNEKQKKQADRYGVHGVLQDYTPHMTLFYHYPPDAQLQLTAEKALPLAHHRILCVGSYLAIGELGYNGNLVQVLDRIPF